ncbi:MAG TPA: type II secretion system protein [Tepidisphaeraceae bacterium]|nr:type II secretion system protein [Tepidisphaeraceae bacterium]
MKPTRHVRRRIARAFTLIELVVSMSVMGIIIGTAALSIMFLLRTAQGNRDFTSDNSAAASFSGQGVLAQSAMNTLDADLRIATTITNTPLAGGGMQVSLVVPGRYAGDVSEAIVYTWNGPGSSLMRQLNSAAAVSIADNVQALNIATVTRSIGTPSPAAGSEQVIFTHDGGNGAGVQLVAISASSAISQAIIPSLPASTGQWSITHVKLQLQQTGTGSVAIQLFSADAAGHPLGLLAGASLDAASLPGSATTWTDVTLGASGLAAGAGVCVVVSTSAVTSPASAQIDTAAVNDGTGEFATSSDAGATWTTAATPPAMQIQVYGTITPGVAP